MFYLESYETYSGIMQVEVPGGRGKPATIVDKDEGLGKVRTVSLIGIMQVLVAFW